jgi:small subunit ribosomal protein S13
VDFLSNPLSRVFIGVDLIFQYLSAQDYRHIVRIVGKDIPGDKKITVGLGQIKGVGQAFANALIGTLNLNPNSNIGFLTESQVETIEKALKDPVSMNFPSWLFNRRKDVETGKTFHLITSDIDFTIRNDVEREKAANSWRGFRHMYGLKVRGQRTRTTGRKGASVGVKKGGKVLPAGAVPAEAPGAAPAGAPGAAAAAPAKGAAPAKVVAPAKGAAPAKAPAADAKAKK